jgi:hypothetical protein
MPPGDAGTNNETVSCRGLQREYNGPIQNMVQHMWRTGRGEVPDASGRFGSARPSPAAPAALAEERAPMVTPRARSSNVRLPVTDPSLTLTLETIVADSVDLVSEDCVVDGNRICCQRLPIPINHAGLCHDNQFVVRQMHNTVIARFPGPREPWFV